MTKTGAELIKIGKITSTHGHKGEVKVLPLTYDTKRFNDLETVWYCRDKVIKELTITQARYHRNFVLLTFAEIPDMDTALELKDGYLKITQDKLRRLPPGSYYIFDIIGLKVVTDKGQELGSIVDVIQTGANDVYDVVDESSGKRLLIPALKQVVQNIDLDNRVMVICPIEGLLD